jgi:hypothetical protein
MFSAAMAATPVLKVTGGERQAGCYFHAPDVWRGVQKNRRERPGLLSVPPVCSVPASAQYGTRTSNTGAGLFGTIYFSITALV